MYNNTAHTYSTGWRWASDDWDVQSATSEQLAPLAGADRDTFGWLYNVDFTSYSATNPGQPTKSMTHFVRRRRVVHTLVFDGKGSAMPSVQHFVRSKCFLINA